MGSIPLPALAARAPEVPSPIQQYGQALSIQDLMQRGKLQQQEVQMGQIHLAGTQAMNDAYSSAVKTDPGTGQPSFDRNVIYRKLAAANQGSLIPGVTKSFNDLDEQAGKIQAAKDTHANAEVDYMGGVANAWKASKYDPVVLAGLAAHATEAGYGQHAQQLLQAIGQNPEQGPAIAEHMIAQSSKQREVGAQEEAAAARMKAAGKQPEGENSLGDKIPQLNQALEQRYQVLNPGKPLPPYLTLQPTATQKDFDRTDKLLESQERATGTKAQQDQTNAIRQQTQSMMQQGLELRQQTQRDTEEQKGLQPVIGTDPKTGKSVLVSQSEAKTMGLTGPMKAEGSDVSKAMAARHFLPLADNPDPGNPGIKQQIDALEKAGKLGPLASRWNDFLAGKYGAGDPDFERLRVSMGLSTTLLMNLHVGSRGGSYMMEHFEDLANSKKMDAGTLKAGVDQELKYAKDRAMLPGGGGGTTAPQAGKLPSFKDWKASQAQQ